MDVVEVVLEEIKCIAIGGYEDDRKSKRDSIIVRGGCESTVKNDSDRERRKLLYARR